MGQIASKLKNLFSQLKGKPKTSVSEATKETEVKSNTDDQALSHEVNESLEQITDEELKELNFEEKGVATDFEYPDDRYPSIEEYREKIALIEKAIEEHDEVIGEYHSQLEAIKELLESKISQENDIVSDEHQKTVKREENGFVAHSEEEVAKQVDDSQFHEELHAVKDVLEEHQTKIEIIREMLETDQGVYCRGKKVKKQLDEQEERLNNQEQSIGDMKEELRKEIRLQKVQLDKVIIGVVVCFTIITIIIALIKM